MARIGQQQLRLLIMTASPCSLLVTTDKVSDSLVRRGLFRQRAEDRSACCITPQGLRALADEMEAGRVDDALEAIRKDAAARRLKMEARAKTYAAGREARR